MEPRIAEPAENLLSGFACIVQPASRSRRRRRGCPTLPRRCRGATETRVSAAAPPAGRGGCRAGTRAAWSTGPVQLPAADARQQDDVEHERRRLPSPPPASPVSTRSSSANRPDPTWTHWRARFGMRWSSVRHDRRGSTGSRRESMQRARDAFVERRQRYAELADRDSLLSSDQSWRKISTAPRVISGVPPKQRDAQLLGGAEQMRDRKRNRAAAAGVQ